MLPIAISPATESERNWAAALMAGFEPWLTLGQGLEECQRACRDPERLLFVAREGTEPCGFILLEDISNSILEAQPRRGRKRGFGSMHSSMVAVGQY